MPQQFDGTIRIDTSIDDKGFNKGVRAIASSAKKSFAGVIKGLKSGLVPALLTVLAVIGTIALALSAIIGIFGILIKLGSLLFRELERSVAPSSRLHDQIVELRTAFDNVKGALIAAFAPLIATVLPYIIIVVNWLVKMLNLLNMIIAAFLGQKTIIVSVGKAASAAAGAASQAAKDARGALAAFDELNVLAQPDEGGGAGGAGGGFLFEEREIENSVLEAVDKIKENIDKLILAFAEMWFAFDEQFLKPIREGFDFVWRVISEGIANWWEIIQLIWGLVWPWFQENVLNPLREEGFGFLWRVIAEGAANLWAIIKLIWGIAWSWFKDNFLDPLKLGFRLLRDGTIQGFSDLWSQIKMVWIFAKVWFLQNVIIPIVNFFEFLFNAIKVKAFLGWLLVSSVWKTAKTWFANNVTNPLRDIFATSLDSIKSGFFTAFEGIKIIVKNAINSIIASVNTMVNNIISRLNSIIQSSGISIPTIPVPDQQPLPTSSTRRRLRGITSARAARIPRLARGAIIPPNSAFAAILGDQTSGRNIEAPEGLIRQIIQEEMGGDGGEIVVRFEGTLGALVRELQPRISKETQRRGKSMLTGGVAP